MVRTLFSRRYIAMTLLVLAIAVMVRLGSGNSTGVSSAWPTMRTSWQNSTKRRCRSTTPRPGWSRYPSNDEVRNTRASPPATSTTNTNSAGAADLPGLAGQPAADAL